ncbi:13728_t:CDS:2, partial [Funneliformis geosporum]
NGKFGKSKKFEEFFGAEENFGIEKNPKENLLVDSDNNISSPNIADEVTEILNNKNEKGKRAIFEYLQRLDKNERGKMAAYLKAAKIVLLMPVPIKQQ